MGSKDSLTPSLRSQWLAISEGKQKIDRLSARCPSALERAHVAHKWGFGVLGFSGSTTWALGAGTAAEVSSLWQFRLVGQAGSRKDPCAGCKNPKL